MSSRVYLVTGPAGARLVKAGTKAAAIAHCARTTFKAQVATQDDLITALGKSVAVETAGAEPATTE